MIQSEMILMIPLGLPSTGLKYCRYKGFRHWPLVGQPMSTLLDVKYRIN